MNVCYVFLQSVDRPSLVRIVADGSFDAGHELRLDLRAIDHERHRREAHGHEQCEYDTGVRVEHETIRRAAQRYRAQRHHEQADAHNGHVDHRAVRCWQEVLKCAQTVDANHKQGQTDAL